MRTRKCIAFVIFLMSTFFLFGIQINVFAVDESYGGIPIYFSALNASVEDIENTHIELMVLKSDFDESFVNTTINNRYKAFYQYHQDFTHLSQGDEISYFAYIKGAFLYREENAFVFDDVNGYIENIKTVRFIIFSNEGEVLASSELYTHLEGNRYYYVEGDYFANLTDLTFSNTRHLVFNFFWIILWVIIFFISFFIVALKYLLGLIFGIQYKKFLKSFLFDAVIIIGGSFMMHFLIMTNIARSFSNLLIVSTSIFLIINVIGYFFFVKKKSQLKFIVASLIHYILVFLILQYVIAPYI